VPTRYRTGPALSEEELARRAKWGGVLSGIPALTAEQREEWKAQRRARADWYPQHGLRFLWSFCDELHGEGPWSLERFLECVACDRRAVVAVSAEHPDQRRRLSDWLRQLEALGREREADVQPRAGYYYTALTALGYRADSMESATTDEDETAEDVIIDYHKGAGS
jgi:hypothetical protein